MTLLSRAECSALRGIAIIGIFMHNYLHWLGPMVKENEYLFHASNAERFWFVLTHPDQNLLYHLFSFFGHYGVPMFVFLSGYGLYLKYESGATGEGGSGITGQRNYGIWQFLKSHYLKLFPMMCLGFAAFAMVDWITPGRHHWTWDAVIEQLTMTVNLFPDPDHRIWPGPYWFFGLMMELYLVYRLLLYRRHWGWNVGLIICCMAIQALCFAEPEGDTLNRIRYNFIGNMLPFGMGLLCARWGGCADMSLCRHIGRSAPLSPFGGVGGGAILSCAFIVFLSLNFWTWLLVPFFVVLAHIGFIKALSSVHWAEPLFKALSWMGGVSAAVFVCHPITRKIFIPISRSGNILDGLVLYVVSTIILAILFKKIITTLK